MTAIPTISDHSELTGIGVIPHPSIDTHILDGSIHFTEGSIDHANILGIGVNSHAQIDTHIADSTVHFTVGSIDHGFIGGLSDDDHAQYLLLAGRAGGQAAFGGTAAGQELILRGTTASNLGQVRFRSPITFDDTVPANALNAYFIQASPPQAITAVFIGGGVNMSPVITFTNSIFIWEGTRISPNITSLVNPFFAAFTLLQALPVLRSATAGFSPLNSLTLNIGVTMENAGIAIPLTAATNFGISFSPQTRVTGVFSSMSVTNQTAVSCRPTFSTIANSTANLGSIRGIHQQNPAPALFQPAAGTETLAANIAVDMDNCPFGGNVLKAAVRSAHISNGTNSYFLLNTGNSRSNFGNSTIEFNDLFGVILGSSQDLGIGWAASNFLFFNFALTGGQIRISNPAAGSTTDRYLFQGLVQSSEFNFNCDRISFGAQSGSVGNSVGVFTTPARTASIGGSWADFLLTHSGNITIDAALSSLDAWAINPVSITAGTGAISGDVAALRIGGMTTSTLGGARTSALYQTGRRTLRGVDEWEPLSPAAFTIDVDDYAPATGNSMRQMWRLTTDDLGAIAITGIAVQQRNDTQHITNIGTVDDISLNHQDVLSVASNRMISPTGAAVVLGPNESAFLWHDDVTDRWRILPHTGA